MSKYTIQLKNLVENGYDIFDFDYPIFDPNYKSVLEQKIIDWYYFREIGLETPGQFKHFLKAKMNVIMPYYNEFYKANEVFKTYDPYKNKNVTQTDTKTTITDTDSSSERTEVTDTTGSSETHETGSNTGNTSGKETFSDTPQAKLNGLDYATNFTETTGTTEGTTKNDVTGSGESLVNATGTATNTGKVTTTDEYISTIAGHDGMRYPTDILKDLRKSFINIDKMIIEELSVLFLNIA